MNEKAAKICRGALWALVLWALCAGVSYVLILALWNLLGVAW